MTKQWKITSLAELPRTAKEILSYFPNEKIFAFLGEMGAGKTTLIAALCAELGVSSRVSSPTFSIVNEYQASEEVFHIDLFRLQSIQEALDAGIEEYLSGSAYCFIEWPQLITPLLPRNTVKIKIDLMNEHERLLTLLKP